MRRREEHVHLFVEMLPARNQAVVKQHGVATAGKLTLHFLPSLATELNASEPVPGHAKRIGAARSAQQKGEKFGSGSTSSCTTSATIQARQDFPLASFRLPCR